MTESSIDRILGYMPFLGPAAVVTIMVSLASIALATVVGIVAAMGSRSSGALIRRATRTYIELARAIPELVQIYIWFFLLPEFGIVLPPIVAGVLALGFAFGGYLAEVFRGGIEAIDAHQWEAGRVLGMGRLRTWTRVIIPQAFISVFPIWTSYFVSTFKATAFLSIITVPDLMRETHRIASLTFRYFELFTIALIFYFVIGYTSIVLLRRVEERWNRVLRPSQRAIGAGLGAQGV